MAIGSAPVAAVGTDTLGLVLLGAFALLFVPILVATLAYDRTLRRYFANRHGVSTSRVAVAVVAGIGTFLAFAALGSFPESGTRGLAVPLVGTVFGAVALVFAGGHARTVARLVRAGDTRTGDVTTGTVAVTGLVEGETTETPFFGVDAVAWSWRVEAKNRHGTNYSGRRAWEVARVGTGGVSFTVDDGSGGIEVVPEDARFDLSTARTETRDPSDPPGRAAEVADLDMGGEAFRFTETALERGAEVTVLGTARETADGPVVTAENGPLLVSDGMHRVVRRRFGLRAVGYGAAGLVAVWYSLGWLSSAFGVSLPV